MTTEDAPDDDPEDPEDPESLLSWEAEWRRDRGGCWWRWDSIVSLPDEEEAAIMEPDEKTQASLEKKMDEIGTMLSVLYTQKLSLDRQESLPN